jgi:hypothetical protein
LAIELPFAVELDLVVEFDFVVELALAVELRFAPVLAVGAFPAALAGFGVEVPAGVDACPEALSAGRAARFWLRRWGRELGSPPSTSDERRSIISATSSHQARFSGLEAPDSLQPGCRRPAVEVFADKLKHWRAYGVVTA